MPLHQKTKMMVLSGGVVVALVVLVVVWHVQQANSADQIRLKCYEDTILKKRRVVNASGGSDAYLNQITESALQTDKADPVAFEACQTQNTIPVLKLPDYEKSVQVH